MKKSRIIKLKSQFFINRAVIYFSFLLIPVWAHKTLELTMISRLLILLLYIVFMAGQWYLLGKEIDHRMKIYFKVQSSLDRILYRLIMGNAAFILFFSLMGLLPASMIKHFFWGTWVVLGLFYSWPTRGKIIEETMSSQLSEFKFLDAFEKTVLIISLFLFFVSIPEIPGLENIEVLKLYIDPHNKIHNQFWNFLSLNYFPFAKYPEVLKLAWCLHLYVVGLGIYLLALYCFLRFFVSRRLAILGPFALLSSWSMSKNLGIDPGSTLTTTFSILWIWSLMWAAKSSTYRSGFFLGLVGFWGTIINQSFFILVPIQLALIFFLYLKERTAWYRKQTLRYSVLGVLLTVVVYITHNEVLHPLQQFQFKDFFEEIYNLFDRKAFFSLAIPGIIILVIHAGNLIRKFSEQLQLSKERVNELGLSLLAVFVFAFLFDASILRLFGMMWIFVFLSLIPLELIFQLISRFRSRRNFIYMIYVLVCLLDSHVEGRIKIFSKLF